MLNRIVLGRIWKTGKQEKESKKFIPRKISRETGEANWEIAEKFIIPALSLGLPCVDIMF